MLSRGQRLYVAFTCVLIAAVAVALYVLLVVTELFPPNAPVDWVVASLRLVECCALFYFVTYLSADWIYRRIGAEPERDHVAALSAENQAWLSGVSALALFVAQCTLAVRAGGVELSHLAWIAVAGILLMHAVRSLAEADQHAIDQLFAPEIPLRSDTTAMSLVASGSVAPH